MIKRLRSFKLALFSLAVLGAVLSASSSAWGWGCKGHEIVALIAENHLNPRAQAMALKILAGGPISPSLSRYCQQTGLDPFADSSTWADDERSVSPDTAPWHFIDIPRGAPETSIAQFCPQDTGCITSALTKQLSILRDEKASTQARADALRYVIHFVGDIHQPLHTTTNNDRGGNCVPVGFFDHATHETSTQAESYSPNLHGVWDADIIEQLSPGETPQQVAKELEQKSYPQIHAWQSKQPNFLAWAWESHELSERISYGKLPVPIAIEKPVPVESCSDDNHISTRMLKLNERLSGDYQGAAAPIVQEQLTKAGIRLAALLNAIWH